MTVFCDNGDCCHIGEDGFCGCDKLSIVGGVCAGSCRSGRNACNGDVDERLKAENAKLRELCSDMFVQIEESGFDPMVARQGKRGPYYEEDPSWRVGIRERIRELGIEVDG